MGYVLPADYVEHGYIDSVLGAADIYAIAAAVRAELATELAHMDAPISDVPAEVLASAQVAPIHSRVKIINNTTLTGTGIPTDPMRPV